MAKLWIDDIRPAPEGYIWCKSTLNALHTIFKYRFNEITEINLDHDAGEYAKEGGDFIEILKVKPNKETLLRLNLQTYLAHNLIKIDFLLFF